MYRYTMLGKDRDREPHVAQNVTPEQATRLGKALGLTGFILLPEGLSNGNAGKHWGYIANPDKESGYDRLSTADWVYGEDGQNLLTPPKDWTPTTRSSLVGPE